MSYIFLGVARRIVGDVHIWVVSLRFASQGCTGSVHPYCLFHSRMALNVSSPTAFLQSSKVSGANASAVKELVVSKVSGMKGLRCKMRVV